MKTLAALILVSPSSLACGSPQPARLPAESIVVDANHPHQTIEGFGTCLISWEPKMAKWYERPEAVTMFAKEMGLNILRCNLWGEGTIGPTSDPAAISYRSPDFALHDDHTPVFIKFAQAVRKFNPDLKVIGTVWSPPGWMKMNGNIHGAKEGGIDAKTYLQDGMELNNRVKSAMYPHFAKWLTEMVRYYEANGVPIYAVSAANEPQFTQSFESCVWTAPDLARITGLVGNSLKNAGLGRVRMFGPETMTGFNWPGGPNPTYIAAFQANPDAWSSLGFLASHGYTDGVSPDISSNASAQFWDLIKDLGKPYWVTEGATGGHAWPEPVREKGVGIAIHNALVAGNASAFVPWQFAEDMPSEHNLTVLDRLDKKGQVVRQFARFIPAGSVLIDATPAFGRLAASAFVKGRDVTIVLINPKPVAARATLNLKGLPGVASLNVVRTSEHEDGVVLPPIALSPNGTTLEIPADAIVTLTTLSPKG